MIASIVVVFGLAVSGSWGGEVASVADVASPEVGTDDALEAPAEGHAVDPRADPRADPHADPRPPAPSRPVNRLLIGALAAAGTCALGGAPMFCCSGSLVFGIIPLVCAPVGAAAGAATGLAVDGTELALGPIALAAGTAFVGALALNAAALGTTLFLVPQLGGYRNTNTLLGVSAGVAAGAALVSAAAGAAAYVMAPETVPDTSARSRIVEKPRPEKRALLAMAY